MGRPIYTSIFLLAGVSWALGACGDSDAGELSGSSGASGDAGTHGSGATGGTGTGGAAGTAGDGGVGGQPEPEPTHVVAKNHPDGCDDAGPGTSAAPWCTIGHAAATVPPGARVLIKAGIYQENVVLDRSGTPTDPVTFMGERDGTDFLTVIDPSVPLSSGWVPATEPGLAGAGIYKHSKLPFAPHGLFVDNKRVLHLTTFGAHSGVHFPGEVINGTPIPWPGKMAFEELVPAGDAIRTYTNPWSGVVETMPYWDTIEAMMIYYADTVWLKFRNGDDPNGKDIRISPAPRLDFPNGSPTGLVQPGASTETGVGVRVVASYNVLRNLHVRGSHRAVELTGESAHHNVVENNLIEHGQFVVRIADGAHSNVVRSNEIRGAHYQGNPFGAWSGHWPTTTEQQQAHWGYQWPKNWEYASTPNLLSIQRAGDDNVVSENHFHSSTGGVAMGDYLADPVFSRTVIANNSFENLSSTAVYSIGGHRDTRIHDNVIRNVNIAFRFNAINADQSPNQRVYVYRNLVTNGNWGTFWYANVMDAAHGAAKPELFFYHNSANGGSSFLGFTSTALGYYENVRVFNNIASTRNVIGGNPGASAGSVGEFDYNLLRGSELDPAWIGSNNRYQSDYEWPLDPHTDGVIAPSSLAHDAGRTLESDLPDSQPIHGAPDMGAHEILP
jgi:hypothetical protein